VAGAEGDPREAHAFAPLPGHEDTPRGALRGELLAALELAGLTGLAFTRPVLDSFGRAPETFLTRSAEPSDVVVFALVVAALPLVVVALAGAAGRLAGGRVRGWVHLGLVGVLGGLMAWRLGTDAAPWGPRLLLVVGLIGGLALVAVRSRLGQSATYLRFLGGASVVFLVQFLVFSPSSSLATGGDPPTADGELAEAVLEANDGQPPPVVMVVVDALPTVSLMDGQGGIDAELYPNLAELAGGATWYRNHTTTSAWTYQAVPAMLSGRLPQLPSELPNTHNYPDNLFTLFAGTHDITATEQLTQLCPREECPRPGGSAVPALLRDAVDWWRGGLQRGNSGGGEVLPGALDPGRADEFTRWIAGQDFSPAGDPGMWFYHLVMPHDPWVVLDDLTPYVGAGERPYGMFMSSWLHHGAAVARQRHLLQAQGVDRALGQLVDELEAAGTYDDALIVVAGDHGEAFTADHPKRGLADAQYEQVAWTPLIVKAPGQSEGVVDDANVWNVDLVPTVADLLGIDLPWDVDGVPAGSRPSSDKQVLDSEQHEFEPAEGSDFVDLDGREGLARVLAADPVPGSGEHAVWQRTEHGTLVGRAVEDLEVAAAGGGGEAGGTITVEQLDRIEQQGDEPPLLEVVGRTSLGQDEVIALTVNGVVAAVAPLGVDLKTMGDGTRLVHALLLPDPFEASNEVQAYRVTGPRGDEVLHELTVTGT